MDEAILSAISTVGFPIVVSFYLLVRIQKSLDRFSNRLDQLLRELQRGYYLNKPKAA